MGRVTVIGSLNIDLVVSLGRWPEVGETVLGQDLMVTEGGKGANQAVAAARAGADVAMAGCVGADAFGRQLKESLETAGVDVRWITEANAPTGMAFIWVLEGGESRIVLAPGANAASTSERVGIWLDNMCRPEILLLQLEIPLEGVRRALADGREQGVMTVLDPAPAPEEGLPPDILEMVGVLTPNALEASLLTGIQVTGPASASRAADELRRQGADTVIVTMGSAGALVADPEGVQYFPAFPVETRDETAAGDAFSGTLAAQLARGVEIESAVRTASAAGALASTAMGAQISLPGRDDLDLFLSERNDEGWPTQQPRD